jgi:hypothetical protein
VRARFASREGPLRHRRETPGHPRRVRRARHPGEMRRKYGIDAEGILRCVAEATRDRKAGAAGVGGPRKDESVISAARVSSLSFLA